MKHFLMLSTFNAIISLIFGTAAPTIVPALNLPDHVRQSDLIVLGSVTSTNVAGTTSLNVNGTAVEAQILLADILIDQVLKGQLDTGMLQCQIVLPNAPIGYGSISPNEYRVIFLKRRGDDYQLTSPYYPSLPAVPVNMPGVGEALDRVLLVLSAVLESPSVDPNSKRVVISHLARTRTPVSRVGLRKALKEPNDIVRVSAAGALLEQGDLSALTVAEEVLMRPDAGIPEPVLQTLRAAIERGTKTGSAVPSLARLLRSPVTATRRVAASALRGSTSASATEHLISALDDSDLEVRYTAVIALAERTGHQQFGPSFERFRRDEHPFISYWKDWAKRR